MASPVREKPPTHASYTCPVALIDGDPARPNEDEILGWFHEAEIEGLAFLNTQPGFGLLDKAIDIITGRLNEQLPSQGPGGGAFSRINANLIKRSVSEQISVLTDLRDFWAFKTANKAKWGDHAIILNGLTNDWYHNTFVDLSIKEALQYAATLGTGYLSPFWKVNARRRGVGDVALQSYGARDVLPIQLPSNHNLQEAYAVIIKDEMPITLAWRQWPELQHRIVPDRDLPTMAAGSSDGSLLGRVGRSFMDMVNPTKNREDDQTPFPMVDVFYIYIDDFSINTSGRTMPMGKPGTSFYYEVPSLHSDIPAGKSPSGQPLSRKAERSDCQLYPNRRLIICTRNVLIQDGPSYWWHGQVPLVKFTLDDWVWNYLGFSMVLETASIADSYNSHLRVIDDSAAARLQPPFLWDKNSIAKTDAMRFNPRRPNIQLMYDGNKSVGDTPIKFPVPADYYNVPEWIISNYLPMLKNTIGELLGVPDLKALAKARQVPSGDAIEKLMEMAGPIVRGMSRSMERSLRGLGQQVGSMFFQFYDTQRRISTMGEDGITEEDFDFDPTSIIPADEPGFVTTRMERARVHQDNFSFHIIPGSLHAINQTSRKLLYLQLFRSGFPIDPATVAKALDLPDFGDLPGLTIFERWGAWMDLQATIAQQMGEAGSGGPGQGAHGGRPPSGQKMPALVQKSDGRTTITES